MTRIDIKTDSHYRINRQRVRRLIGRILERKKIKSKVDISINVVGDRKMRSLNKKYQDIDETTAVLSFPLFEERGLRLKPFIFPPDDVLPLGDIVISYPQARKIAAQEEKLVDDVIDELVKHGLKHLLGNHNNFKS